LRASQAKTFICTRYNPGRRGAFFHIVQTSAANFSTVSGKNGPTLANMPTAVSRSGIFQAQARAKGPPPEGPNTANLSIFKESASSTISFGQSQAGPVLSNALRAEKASRVLPPQKPGIRITMKNKDRESLWITIFRIAKLSAVC